ncbi:MAG TPA: prepilin-type N-terminal cleavage/methylation domain-containing protein [Anaeromyxobacteraceae bacterium]|nr:prepilin-type N-terminal cleavage/methylation domain-containing protein [Anaeromyxobacteraceae bacterium]
MTGRRRGFTLIELLVVMAIIATLLTIVVPRYFRSLERSKEAVLKQDLSVLRESIDKFYGDTGKYPQTLQALVEKHYLRSIPVDPIARAADKWIVVNSEDPEDGGVRDVRSGAEGTGENGVPYGAW